MGFNLLERFKARLDGLLSKQVEIRVLDFQRAKRLNQKDLEHVTVKGVVIDETVRVAGKRGGSYHVSHPEGWVVPICSTRKVHTQLLLLEGSDERVILITKPKGGEG